MLDLQRLYLVSLYLNCRHGKTCIYCKKAVTKYIYCFMHVWIKYAFTVIWCELKLLKNWLFMVMQNVNTTCIYMDLSLPVMSPVAVLIIFSARCSHAHRETLHIHIHVYMIHIKYAGFWSLLPVCLGDLFLQHQLWPFLNEVKPLWLLAGCMFVCSSRPNFLWYLILSLLKGKSRFLPHSRSTVFLLLISRLVEVAPELVVGICQHLRFGVDVLPHPVFRALRAAKLGF